METHSFLPPSSSTKMCSHCQLAIDFSFYEKKKNLSMSAEKGQQTFFFMLQRPSHFYFYYLKLKPEKVDLGVLETNKIKDGQHQSSSCKLSGMLFFYE